MLDLVRRGLQHAEGVHVLKRAAPEWPVWGWFLLGLTAVFFVLVLSVIEYTLQYLIAALAVVETPNAAITISPPKENATSEEKEGLLETSPEATLVRGKPITSSIRATLKHLRSEHGRMAYLKGFGYYMLWVVAFSWTMNMFAIVLSIVLPMGLITGLIAAGLAGAVCAPLHAGWTHKVISKHSSITFWQRVPGRSVWKIIALPAAMHALMPYLEILLFSVVIPMVQPRPHSRSEWSVAKDVLPVFGALFVIGAVTLLLYVPIMAILVRTEASLLSEEQDTIVPFDRTFAGKVVPKSMGGSGALSFVDAWKSFDGEGRRRVFKHFIKAFFVMFFMFIVIFHVFIFELLVIMGASFAPVMKEIIGKN